MLPQAVIERQALEAAFAASLNIGAQIVLEPMNTPVRVQFWRGGSAIHVTGEGHKTLSHVQRDHCSHEPWRWYGRERLTDQFGREWDRMLEMVTDDFGNLVEVAS
jgi:hypothetical protein